MKRTLLTFTGAPILVINSGVLPTEQELNFCRNLDTRDHLGDENAVNNAIRLSKESNLLSNYTELDRIKHLLLNCFNDYVDNILEIENQFYMCNSWCTIQKKGDFHPSHTHPNAIFSAVYYAKSDKSILKFSTIKSKIQESFYFEYKIKKHNIFNSSGWRLQVNSGDVVIFPGDLNHESLILKDEQERIIIACSFFARGVFGRNNNYNDIFIKG